MIFIDSSVVYNALVKTELTPLAERGLRGKRSVGKVRKLLQKDEEFRTKAVEYLAGILAFLLHMEHLLGLCFSP